MPQFSAFVVANASAYAINVHLPSGRSQSVVANTAYRDQSAFSVSPGKARILGKAEGLDGLEDQGFAALVVSGEQLNSAGAAVAAGPPFTTLTAVFTGDSVSLWTD